MGELVTLGEGGKLGALSFWTTRPFQVANALDPCRHGDGWLVGALKSASRRRDGGTEGWMDDGDGDAAAAAATAAAAAADDDDDDDDDDDNECVWVYYDDLFPHDQMMYRP